LPRQPVSRVSLPCRARSLPRRRRRRPALCRGRIGYPTIDARGTIGHPQGAVSPDFPRLAPTGSFRWSADAWIIAFLQDREFVDSALTAEQELMRDAMRRLVAREIEPLIAAHPADRSLPKPAFLDALARLAELGVTAARLPGAMGGSGVR